VLVLAFDTSSPAVTVALSRHDRRLAEHTEVATNRHGELLAPLIAAVLSEGGVSPHELDAVAVGLGPGPFTGLRVGIMTAKSLGDALAIPSYGECSLDVIAAGVAGWARDDEGGEHDFAVLSDARRKQVYWATYSCRGDRLTDPQLSPPAAVAGALDGRTRYVVGAGVAAYPDLFDGFQRNEIALYPSAATLADMTFSKLTRQEPEDDLTPLYLRRPDAVPPGAPKQVTPA
jgi:tRNA threonylcarbamoyl adenosine modification protein YeaZ